MCPHCIELNACLETDEREGKVYDKRMVRIRHGLRSNGHGFTSDVATVVAAL